MKAISIRQPWAWLIIAGHKQVENRTWKPSLKENTKIAIHAGKKFDGEGYDWVRDNFPYLDIPKSYEYEMGGIVGTAVYMGYEHIDDAPNLFDDSWFFGPYGWMLWHPEKIKFIPYRGQLGVFNVDLTVSNIA